MNKRKKAKVKKGKSIVIAITTLLLVGYVAFSSNQRLSALGENHANVDSVVKYVENLKATNDYTPSEIVDLTKAVFKGYEIWENCNVMKIGLELPDDSTKILRTVKL